MNLGQIEFSADINQKLLFISILNVWPFFNDKYSQSISGQLKSPQRMRSLGLFPFKISKDFFNS